MNILTKEEALKALRAGKKLYCNTWKEEEYIFMENDIVYDEGIYQYNASELITTILECDLYLKGDN